MRIVLVTPLYPPDIGGAAAYCKELAQRLAQNHEVTILTYAHLPERVESVRTISVDKRRPLIIRLSAFTVALFKITRHADVIFAENGGSAELPAALIASVTRTPMVLHRGDQGARAWAQKRTMPRLVERFARSRARHIIDNSPPPRPEILPFAPRPEQALNEYESAWTRHLAEITPLLHA